MRASSACGAGPDRYVPYAAKTCADFACATASPGYAGMTIRLPAALEAEGLALLARGYGKLAEAAEARLASSDADAGPEWIAPSESPLGKRQTLELARAGELESSKVGRKVLVRRASLDRYLDAHRREGPANDGEDEDLFGAKAS